MRRAALPMVVALAGCVTAGDVSTDSMKPRVEDDPRFGAAVDTMCFTAGLSGFFEVGNRAVVLRRGVNETYLVRTGYCRTLRRVEGLRLADSAGCLKRGDRLEVYEQPFPREGERRDQPERCLVTAIHRWWDVDVDAPFYEEP